jgi:hypothetical protein
MRRSAGPVQLALLGIASLLLALAAAAAAPAARAATSAGERQVAALAQQGLLAPAEAAGYAQLLRSSRSAVRRLSGARRTAVAGASAAAESLAGSGELTAERARPVFANLRATLTWLVTQGRAVPASGARATFDGSPVVYSFQPAAGWQIHPLANWGQINALVASRSAANQARGQAHADAMIALAARRGGALVNEYYFPYLGAGPGWVSAMPTATSLRPLALLYARTLDPRYLDAVRGALVVLSTPPPAGTRLVRGPGLSHYLLYAQEPRLLVGNSFVQALIGLHDFVQAMPVGAEVGTAAQLLAEGLAEAHASLPAFDTGSWSYYERGYRDSLSNRHYHDFFGDRLRALCSRYPADALVCDMGTRFAAYPTLEPTLTELALRAGRREIVVRVRAAAQGTGRVVVRAANGAVRALTFGVRGGAVNRLRVTRAGLRGTVSVEVSATSMDGASTSTARGRVRLPRA